MRAELFKFVGVARTFFLHWPRHSSMVWKLFLLPRHPPNVNCLQSPVAES